MIPIWEYDIVLEENGLASKEKNVKRHTQKIYIHSWGHPTLFVSIAGFRRLVCVGEAWCCRRGLSVTRCIQGLSVFAMDASKAKVAKLHLNVRFITIQQENILRLYVSMDDAMLVKIYQGF